MLEEHANLFGSGALKSAGADKGYWTANNLRAFTKRGIQECGLQCPGNVKRRKGLPSKSSRAPPPSPGRNRGVDWSHETGRSLRQKSNEERCGDFSRRVRVCARLQFAANSSVSEAKAERGKGEGGLRVSNITGYATLRCHYARSTLWAVHRDPSLSLRIVAGAFRASD